jgi:hypothetical protein
MPVGRAFIAEGGLLVPFDRGVPITPPGPGGGSPPPPPPPGRGGMLVGASIAQGISNDFVPATQAAAGPWTVARRYQSGSFGATWATDTSGVNVDVGRRASVYSCKPSMSQMAAGTLDAALTAFVQSIPDSHLAFLLCWHEPDVKYRQGGGAGGTFDIALWKAANTRFMQVVKAVAKPRVYTGICLTNFSAIGGVPADSQPEAFWFGGDGGGTSGLIDFVSWDMYMTSNTINSGSHDQAAPYAFTRSHNVAYGISEIGIHDAVTNFASVATWMHNQADYAATNASGTHSSAAFLTWFNSSNATALPVPSQDPQLVTASGLISAQYFTAANSFSL